MTAGAGVDVIGVYPVSGVPSCFLVEMWIEGSDSAPDFGQFTQPSGDRPQSDWQVAYDERLLEDAGERELTNLLVHHPGEWPDRARIAFFFHDLDVQRPFGTPFGEVDLPLPTEVPQRLAFVGYQPP